MYLQITTEALQVWISGFQMLVSRHTCKYRICEYSVSTKDRLYLHLLGEHWTPTPMRLKDVEGRTMSFVTLYPVPGSIVGGQYTVVNE